MHLDELAENIRQHGLNDPIVLYDGKILDGRSRFTACQKVKVAPRFVNFDKICPSITKEGVSQDEKDKIAFDWVISHNVHRRHLNPSQRALLVANIANMRAGNPTWGAASSEVPQVPQKDAAAKAGVSPALVSQAQKVMREAPEKAIEIQSGKSTINQAVREINAEKVAQKAAQKDTEPKEPKTAFAKAVIDGTHTGKAFRKRIGDLTKLIEQCSITVPIVEYLNVCSTLTSLENIVTTVESLPKFVVMKDLTKRIDALKKEQQDLCDEITDVLIFCHKTYAEWSASLKQMAATDEEKALLDATDALYKEHLTQVNTDMKMSQGVRIQIVETTIKQVSSKDALSVFDVSQLLATHGA
jgi:DNA-binding transcriptional regulator YdaS (Cro superfamily)